MTGEWALLSAAGRSAGKLPAGKKAVNSLLENADTDIYVTGSNSKLMSSEISTLFNRAVYLIPVYTLSFAEYLDFKNRIPVLPRSC